jgi:predicted RND superfamily exporter protein
MRYIVGTPIAAPPGQLALLRYGGAAMDNLNFGSAQTGDVKAGDIAGDDINKEFNYVYNVTTSLEVVTRMLREDFQRFEARIEALEIVERQHANEKQALTKLIINLANESKTVSDVHGLLNRQIIAETAERSQRRRYLDSMLTALIVLTVIGILINLFRVFRRPAGGAAIT